MSQQWNLHRSREWVHVQLCIRIQWNTVSNRLGCTDRLFFGEVVCIIRKGNHDA